jgi:hypothetical protein
MCRVFADFLFKYIIGQAQNYLKPKLSLKRILSTLKGATQPNLQTRSIQNHNKTTDIPNRKCSCKKYVQYFKSENELQICIFGNPTKFPN